MSLRLHVGKRNGVFVSEKEFLELVTVVDWEMKREKKGLS
jgi:hypothetical protein